MFFKGIHSYVTLSLCESEIKKVGDIQNVLENLIVEILNNIKLCEEYI
jgi:hypothetical protein